MQRWQVSFDRASKIVQFAAEFPLHSDFGRWLWRRWIGIECHFFCLATQHLQRCGNPKSDTCHPRTRREQQLRRGPGQIRFIRQVLVPSKSHGAGDSSTSFTISFRHADTVSDIANYVGSIVSMESKGWRLERPSSRGQPVALWLDDSINRSLWRIQCFGHDSCVLVTSEGGLSSKSFLEGARFSSSIWILTAVFGEELEEVFLSAIVRSEVGSRYRWGVNWNRKFRIDHSNTKIRSQIKNNNCYVVPQLLR